MRRSRFNKQLLALGAVLVAATPFADARAANPVCEPLEKSVGNLVVSRHVDVNRCVISVRGVERAERSAAGSKASKPEVRREYELDSDGRLDVITRWDSVDDIKASPGSTRRTRRLYFLRAAEPVDTVGLDFEVSQNPPRVTVKLPTGQRVVFSGRSGAIAEIPGTDWSEPPISRIRPGKGGERDELSVKPRKGALVLDLHAAEDDRSLVEAGHPAHLLATGDAKCFVNPSAVFEHPRDNSIATTEAAFKLTGDERLHAYVRRSCARLEALVRWDASSPAAGANPVVASAPRPAERVVADATPAARPVQRIARADEPEVFGETATARRESAPVSAHRPAPAVAAVAAVAPAAQPAAASAPAAQPAVAPAPAAVVAAVPEVVPAAARPALPSAPTIDPIFIPAAFAEADKAGAAPAAVRLAQGPETRIDARDFASFASTSTDERRMPGDAAMARAAQLPFQARLPHEADGAVDAAKCLDVLREAFGAKAGASAAGRERLREYLAIQGKLTLHRLAWAYLKLDDGRTGSIEQTIDELLLKRDPALHAEFARTRSGGARPNARLAGIAGALRDETARRFGGDLRALPYLMQASDLKMLDLLARSEAAFGNGGEHGVMSYAEVIRASYEGRLGTPELRARNLAIAERMVGELRARAEKLHAELAHTLRRSRACGASPAAVLATCVPESAGPAGAGLDQLLENSRELQDALLGGVTGREAAAHDALRWGSYWLRVTRLPNAPR